MPLPHGVSSGHDRAKPRRGTGAPRALAVAGSLWLGACAGPGPLATLVPGEPLTTGSIAAGSAGRALTLGLGGVAFAQASLALADALDPMGGGEAVSWTDPASGARGTIAAAGPPRVEGALVCRRFDAHTLPVPGATPTTEAVRHEGRACRVAARTWRIEEAARAEAEAEGLPGAAATGLPTDLLPRPSG